MVAGDLGLVLVSFMGDAEGLCALPIVTNLGPVLVPSPYNCDGVEDIT